MVALPYIEGQPQGLPLQGQEHIFASLNSFEYIQKIIDRLLRRDDREDFREGESALVFDGNTKRYDFRNQTERNGNCGFQF